MLLQKAFNRVKAVKPHAGVAKRDGKRVRLAAELEGLCAVIPERERANGALHIRAPQTAW